MSNTTYQRSVVDLGSFVDGEWRCSCEEKAVWRTAKTDASRGKKCRAAIPIEGRNANISAVLRCNNLKQCKFFLWEEDEASAREKSLQGPSTPQTPTRRPNDPSAAFPTPTSRHSATAQRSGAASKGISATDVSPIPFTLTEGSRSSGNGDLPTKILGFLRDRNVELSSADEIVLHDMVSTEVTVYELRLSRAEETIQKLSRN